jgi:hypothetical protein
MTHYQDGRAFRQALEERLRSRSLNRGVPLARLRKIVAFDRFLARLNQYQPGEWILKGGFAIELRLADKARTTKDIDVLVLNTRSDILTSLRNAGKLDLLDWFQFEVQVGDDGHPDGQGSLRFNIQSLLDGRKFEEFHMDVGIGDPVIDPIEYILGPALLDFAEIQPVLIPSYPVTQQIAEKFHAYTRPHTTGEGSRVKDMVDILLLAGLGGMNADRLLQAIKATFSSRKTHALPAEVPQPPVAWVRPYQNLAEQVSLQYRTLDDATAAIRHFLNPVLYGANVHQWSPDKWEWS